MLCAICKAALPHQKQDQALCDIFEAGAKKMLGRAEELIPGVQVRFLDAGYNKDEFPAWEARLWNRLIGLIKQGKK